MSYQVLEQWAALGIGAAILPKSKVAASGHASFPITDKAGGDVTISFEATWLRTGTQSTHLLELANHLHKIVPGIVGDMALATKR